MKKINLKQKYWDSMTTATKITYCIIITLCVIGAICADILITAGIVALLALCFGFTFSWKLALSVWIVIFAIKGYCTDLNK